jgi:DNA-binding MarR family transcriptional regulator
MVKGAPCPRSVGHELWLAGLGWHREVQRALKPHGITATQFLVLDACSRLHEPGAHGAGVMAIARATGIGKVTAHRVVIALEDRHLLARHPSFDRYLTWWVELEPAGTALLKETRAIVEDTTKRYLQDCNDEALERELAAITPAPR